MVFIYIVMALTILLSFVTLTLQYKKIHSFRFITKCLASLGFLTMSILALSLLQTLEAWHFAIVVALIFGLMGDVFLGTKDMIHKKYFDSLMLMGMLFFLFGHIVYIAVFVVIAQQFLYWLLSLIIIFPLAIYAIIKLKIINPQKAAIPIIIYSLVIGAMALCSINYLIVSDVSKRAILIFVGAMLFCLSDTLLAFFNFKEFQKEKSKRILSYIYLPAYYIAQTLFVLAMLS